ncbi:MAG: glycosyltransferase family A protein [Stellaceae bacterium]
MIDSIVVPTRNRAPKLSACLATVARIHIDIPWELIVVDNGSTDATATVIGESARTAVFPVIAAHEPIAGSYWARNTGWQAARGRFVALTDDDCYVGCDKPPGSTHSGRPRTL